MRKQQHLVSDSESSLSETILEPNRAQVTMLTMTMMMAMLIELLSGGKCGRCPVSRRNTNGIARNKVHCLHHHHKHVHDYHEYDLEYHEYDHDYHEHDPDFYPHQPGHSPPREPGWNNHLVVSALSGHDIKVKTIAMIVMIKMLYFEYKDHFRNIICRLLEQMEGGSVGGITTVNMINGTYNDT